MNDLLNLTIHRGATNRGAHKVEYCIYTSIMDVQQNNDPALMMLLSSIGWDSDDDFEHPIIRIYNILDDEGKPIDESHIKNDMNTTIFFIDKVFEEDGEIRPIYFTSILDLYSSVSDSTEAVEKYKKELAYECMQFELAGFFNIRAMIRSLKFIPFVYANESAQEIYSKLINPML